MSARKTPQDAGDRKQACEARAPAPPLVAADAAFVPHPRVIAGLRGVLHLGSLLVIALGCLVLVGWARDIAVLKSLHPSFVSMKANTALGFLLGGVVSGLYGQTSVQALRWSAWPARAGAVMVTMIGALTLFEYLSGVSLGIDELLFRETADAVATSSPGRMAPNTAFGFLVVGLGFLLQDRGGPRCRRCAQWLFLLAGGIAFLAMLGYVYGVETLYGLASFTSMAVHTSAGFLLLCAASLCLHVDAGWMATLASATPGGQVARRLLPVVVGLPVGLGWLCGMGYEAGYFEDGLGLSLMVALCAGILAALVWRNARLLDQADLERRRGSEAMRQLNAQLETSVRELEAFSYSVSHDLRTPLRGMDGFSQILLEEYSGRLDAQGVEYLQRIRAGTQRMSSLIDDLLKLSRIARSEMKREPVDLGAIARAVGAALARAQPGRDVVLRIGACLDAEGDPRLLRLVLDNLLGNAWKFSSTRAQAVIELGSMEQHGERVFFLRDNGVGFDMKYIGKLFGAFERLHRVSEFEGTGIGLATVKRVIERHGGRIWAEAAVDEGATFYFTLPAGQR